MFKKWIMVFLGWFKLVLIVTIALSLLGMAKVILRTNPEIAVAVLGAAIAMFLVWYFAKQE